MKGGAKVHELLQSLKKKNVHVPATLDKQVTEIVDTTGKMRMPESRAKQEKMLRQVNYGNVQMSMDRWLPVVKLNREKDQLNFTEKVNNNVRVNFFPSNSKTPLTERIESQLKTLQVASEKQLVDNEQKTLAQLPPEEARQRMRQMRKQRSLVFYEEMKRKRISKIKSKLYHRIKKRQRVRAEMEKYNQMDNQQKEEELEKLKMKRAQERISLRHKTKNKHIQDLMRFSKGNKNKIQDSINQLNRIRKQQLERLDEEVVKEISEEYDEENFRQQAFDDLKNQIEVIENLEKDKSAVTGLKFMDKALVSKLKGEKKQAYRLLEKIAKNDMEIEDDDPADTPEEDQERIEVEPEVQHPEQPITRKKFIKQNEKASKSDQKKIKPESHNKILDGYIYTETGKPIPANPTDQNALLKNIDTDRLKKKYESKRVDPINIQKFIQENEELFDNIAAQENRADFQKQKEAEYEANDPQPKPKVTKGWGSWTGPGIAEKPADPKKQLQQKLKRIQAMKKSRLDGQNPNVIIHEYRNKEFAREYLVQKLPHQYSSKEQFEYAHQAELGPEWNSMKNFKQLIKPKIITKVGEVIEPVKMPRKIAKIK